MSKSVFTNSASQICDQLLASISEKNQKKIIVFGIDGPTAAGKTIFADTLADRIRSVSKKDCWLYRLDWHLVERERRAQDLRHLSQQDVCFLYEAELHMRLERFGEFLQTVRIYNEELDSGRKMPKQKISLEGLYSREEGGRLSAKAECILKPGMIILAEGHYTLRTEFCEGIDHNILLLADQEELLARKIARVKEYRGQQDAEDYFRRVDLPSFCHHLARFGPNASHVIDNTDFKAPLLKEGDFVSEWVRNSSRVEKRTGFSSWAGVIESVLSSSLMVDHSIRQALEAALGFIMQWDQHIGAYLRISIDDIQGDLISISQELIERLIQDFRGRRVVFSIKHTNTLYNVYNRILPITIGLQINGERDIRILADAFQEHIRLQIIWAGGYFCLHVCRKLGEIAHEGSFSIEDKTPDEIPWDRGVKPIKVFTPTMFTIPSFLKELESDLIFSGHEAENISASEALSSLAVQGGVWVHRFAQFSELNYFMGIVEQMGGVAVKAGNYLIGIFSKDTEVNRRFKEFRVAWAKRVTDQDASLQDERDLDLLVDKQRRDLMAFVKQHCSDFIVVDGFLHCSQISQDPEVWRRVVDQIALMLQSNCRLLRKRTVQFIQKYLPELTLEVAQLWDDVPSEAKTHISLEALTLLSPSILAEIYLWLALRDDRAALLGATIYDIRRESLDCSAYLSAACGVQTAIVLQASLNAVGQKEKAEGGASQGYLQPDQGVEDLIQAALSAVRDLVLVEGKNPPLFGIGIDHVDVSNDRPAGRAKRFVQAALKSEQVTHYVLDGSGLFDPDGPSFQSLERSFEKVCSFAIDLMGRQEETYIYDKEICSGVLNYMGGSVNARIPTIEEMQMFVRILRDKLRVAGLGAQNTRPTLFIGNLGTTHHGLDTGEVPVEQARVWRDKLKRDNFVSAVLHGTTGTHPMKLEQATAGCHKINVAGDFLETLVKALPERLQIIISAGGAEPKRSLYKVRAAMDELSYTEISHIRDSLKARCRAVLDNINTPKLSATDIEYFRYKNYKFTGRQVEVIRQEILKQVLSYALVQKGKPMDPFAGYQFSASMIEVPFDEKYKEFARALWEQGVRYFHVDVGDGKFVAREFSGLEKTQYLRDMFPEAVLHCHLMAENPHRGMGRNPSLIERYIKAGCNSISIHTRAFTSMKFFNQALALIRGRGARPGLIIETTQTLDTGLEQLVLETGIDWVVLMGVPVGYGGQIFDMSTLKRISWFHQFATSHQKSLLIEVDGGLTMENVPLCRRAGAQIFSGWTIVKAESIPAMKEKVRRVKELIA